MSDLYENLVKATDNTNDITNERYATITKINNDICSVIEDDSNLEHSNVPILNKIHCETGDKVIVGFVGNSIYNPYILGNLTRKSGGGGGIDIDTVKDLINEAINGLDIDLDVDLMNNGYMKIETILNKREL